MIDNCCHIKYKFYKKVFSSALVFIFLSTFFVAAVSAETLSYQLPKVKITEIKIDSVDSNSNLVKGSFRVKSENSEHLPGLFYSIQILSGLDPAEQMAAAASQNGSLPATIQSQTIIDTWYSDQQISLTPAEEKTIKFSYTAPGNIPTGQYTIGAQLYNTTGLTLSGINAVDKISLKGTGKYLNINPKSLKVILDDEAISASAGVNFKVSQIPQIKYSIANDTSAEIEAKPKVSIYRYTLLGELVEEVGLPLLSISADQSVTMTSEMPQIPSSGSYLAVLRFYDENDEVVSNPALFRWVILGNNATVLAVVLDDDYYNKNDTIKIDIDYTGAADYHIERSQITPDILVKVTNKDNQLCGTFQDKALLGSAVEKLRAEIVSQVDCTDPKVEISIEQDGEVFGTHSTQITSKPVDQFVDSVQKPTNILLIFLVVAALLAISLLGRHYLTGKK